MWHPKAESRTQPQTEGFGLHKYALVRRLEDEEEKAWEPLVFEAKKDMCWASIYDISEAPEGVGGESTPQPYLTYTPASQPLPYIISASLLFMQGRVIVCGSWTWSLVPIGTQIFD